MTAAPVRPMPDPETPYGLERHVSVRVAADLLGRSVKGLGNDLARGACPELRAAKVYGRWRIPVSAIRDVYERGRERAYGKAIPMRRRAGGRRSRR